MWNGHKIAYICATFFGTRFKQNSGTTNRYFEWYFPALKKHATCIDRVVVPCNVEKWHIPHYAEFERAARDFEDETGIPVITFHRPNYHYSYGAWNEALRWCCDGIDFAFLMEDDYVVSRDGFDKELLDRYYDPIRQLGSKERVLYCASLFYNGHAAISNGIMNVKLFRKYGNTFHLHPANVGTRNQGPKTQVEFLESFAGKDLVVRNMAAEYRMPFYAHQGGLKFHGNGNGSIVFHPIELGPEELLANSHDNPILPEELHVCQEGGFDVWSGGTV